MEPASSATFGVALITTVGAFIGALISHFLTQRRGLDAIIYKHREEAYKVLWGKTSLLPKWPGRTDVTYAQLRDFSEDLRQWYFLVGGVYLSDSSRKAYGNLQEALNEPVRTPRPNPVSRPDYVVLQDLCSKLRTELTHDLLSRKRMFLFSR